MINWIYPEHTEAAEPEFLEGVPEAIVRMLNRRGVAGSEKIKDFLSEKPAAGYDPFLLPDLSEAVDTILAAVDEGRKICIYGDYDADGVTACALLYSVLKEFTDEVCYRIPSRFIEGYGLNETVIEELAADGVSLLVTVDCGSSAFEEVRLAKSLGMDVIVTDHHSTSEGQAPDCLFINPKREGSLYPFDGLSGCGVAFKLVQGMVRRMKAEGDDRADRVSLIALLDLVAISTVADVVPLLDENRSLVKYGLDRLNRCPRPGLEVLLKHLRLADREINSDRIAFTIAPNINALGRMGSASTAVELLSSDGSDMQRLNRLAAEMVCNNKERKDVQEETIRLCREAMDSGICGELFPVIFAPDAHEGVAGIVAGNLKERLYRPVFIITRREDGQLKGTGRCIPDIDLHQMLSECEELLVRFGGHAGACGLSLEEDMLPRFRARLQELMAEELRRDPEILCEKLFIEKELGPEEKNEGFVSMVDRMEPFGAANPRPYFSISRAKVTFTRLLGFDGQHLKFGLRGDDGIEVECVAFRMAGKYSGLVRCGAVIDVAGEVSVNEYMGQRAFQFIIKDIRRSA